MIDRNVLLRDHDNLKLKKGTHLNGTGSIHAMGLGNSFEEIKSYFYNFKKTLNLYPYDMRFKPKRSFTNYT